MLFMYIHTHSADKCLADKREEVWKIVAQVQEATRQAGIKSLGAYVAAHEHTFYIILEADDLLALEQALVPMTVWGDARLIPVVSMERIQQNNP